MQNRLQNRLNEVRNNLQNNQRINLQNNQYDFYEQDRIRQRMRDEQLEASNILNEFLDRRRFQNADGPEFNNPDDADDNALDHLLDGMMPNFVQPYPANIIENNNNRFMANVADPRRGHFGRARFGDFAFQNHLFNAGDPANNNNRAAGDGAANQDDAALQNSDQLSCRTVLSDIPEEDGFSFANQKDVRFPCWNRFEETQLYMKFIQWEKNSHGLFDYEMSNTKKKFLWTNKDKVVLRDGIKILFEDPEAFDKAKFGPNVQEIFRIQKHGRKFYVEGVKPTDPTKDMDDFYHENGEPTKPPKEMEERMFNVVKFLIVGNNEKCQDYQIKKNDVLKMGRIKFKVKQVVNKSQKNHRIKQMERRKQRLREEKKQFKREMKNFVDNKFVGSSLLNSERIIVVNFPQQDNNEQAAVDGQQQQAAVFKSKYPQDYAKDLLMASQRSIHTPLMGEVDFVHAKTPKYIQRKPSFKENEKEKAIKEEDDQVIVEEVDSLDLHLRESRLEQLRERKNRSMSCQRHSQIEDSRNASDNHLAGSQLAFGKRNMCRSSKGRSKSLKAMSIKDFLKQAFRSQEYRQFENMPLVASNDINEYFDPIEELQIEELNDEQRELVPDKNQRDRTGNYREVEADQEVDNAALPWHASRSQIADQPSTLTQQILKDKQIRQIEESKEEEPSVRKSRQGYHSRWHNSNMLRLEAEQIGDKMPSQTLRKNNNSANIICFGQKLKFKSINDQDRPNSNDKADMYSFSSSESSQSLSSKDQGSWLQESRQMLQKLNEEKVKKKMDQNNKAEDAESEEVSAISEQQLSRPADSALSNDNVSIVSNCLPQCRICWMDEFNEDNPLLQVCQCRGGVEFIHYECLKNWLKTKEYRQVTTHYTSIYWRQFQCELCKSQLPYTFRNNGRSYNLISLPEFDCDHMILESLTLDVKTSRMVHILHPKTGYLYNFKDHYTIGRGQDCDLKITDISVSRNHCQINFKEGKFWLQDRQSKFGTLVLTQGPVEIAPGTTTGMQIGRTVVVFKTKTEHKKKCKIGQFFEKQIEKEAHWKGEFIKLYKMLQTSKHNLSEQEIREKLKMETFDFRQYMRHLERKQTREEIMRRQELEHEALLAEQTYQKEIKNQEQHLMNLIFQEQVPPQIDKKESVRKDEDRDQIREISEAPGPEPLMVLRNDNEPSVDLKYQIKKQNQNEIQRPGSLMDLDQKIKLQEDNESIMHRDQQNKSQAVPEDLRDDLRKRVDDEDQVNKQKDDLLIVNPSAGLEEESKQKQASKTAATHERVMRILNKDIKLEELKIVPSADYYKAIDWVDSLQNDRRKKDNKASPSCAFSALFEPKEKEQEQIKQLEKYVEERDKLRKIEDIQKSPRIMLTLDQQEQYCKKLRTKYIKEEQPNKQLQPIQGFKEPIQEKISKGFINKDRNDPQRSQDIIDQLNFRKKQIAIRKMCMELERKKEARGNNLEQQQNQNQDNQILERQDPALPVAADQDKEETEKLDKEIIEIDNEIRYIRQLHARHVELTKDYAQVHKGINEVWRQHALNQQKARQLQQQNALPPQRSNGPSGANNPVAHPVQPVPAAIQNQNQQLPIAQIQQQPVAQIQQPVQQQTVRLQQPLMPVPGIGVSVPVQVPVMPPPGQQPVQQLGLPGVFQMQQPPQVFGQIMQPALVVQAPHGQVVQQPRQQQ